MKRVMASFGVLLCCHAAFAGIAGDQALQAWEDGLVSDYAEKLKNVWTDMPALAKGFDAVGQTRSFQGVYAKALDGMALKASSPLLEHENAAIGCLEYAGKNGETFRFASWCAELVKRPLFLTASGCKGTAKPTLAAAADFLADDILVGVGGSAVKGVSRAVSASSFKVRGAFSGNVFSSPFSVGWFFFVDDQPGANWAHPCRYVFIAEDLSAYAVLYAREPAVALEDGNAVELDTFADSSLTKNSIARLEGFNAFRQALYAANRADAAKVDNAIDFSKGDKSHSYAVLISGGGNPSSNYSRYWGDVAMVYSTLRLKYGIPKANIKVLMSSGTSSDDDMNVSGSYRSSPLDLDGDGSGDINYSATKSQIQSVFSDLASRLTSADQLLVFVTDHGDQSDSGTCYLIPWLGSTSYTSYSQVISPSEFASYVSGIACPVAFAMEFCYSGGFISSLQRQSNRVILTACGVETSSAFVIMPSETSSSYRSYDAFDYCNPWAFAFNSAIRGADSAWSWSPWNDDPEWWVGDADTDGNGQISMYEASQKARSFILNTYEYVDGVKYTFCDTPQYGESSSGYGKTFYPVKPGGSTPSRFPFDSFSTARTSTPLTAVRASTTGSNVGATAESGEPLASRTTTVWWAWKASASGEAAFSTSGSDFDTIMGIYTGSSVSSLSQVAYNDDADGGTTSYCSFNAVAGTVYYICIAGWNGASGNIKLTWRSQEPGSGSYTVWFSPGAHGKRTGGGAMKQTVAAGGYATAPTITPNPGYEFAGWTRALGPVNVHNYTVTATYRAKNCGVTFNIGAKGKHTGGGAAKQTIHFGGRVTNPPAVKGYAGWKFLGWDGNIASITRGTTFNAQYDIPVCTATFVIDGKKGRHIGGGDMKQSLTYGGSPVPPGVKPNAGYTFSGWSPAIGPMTKSQTYTAVFR